MKKTILYICVCLAVFLCGCNDLCRDCDSDMRKGNFRLIQDWTRLWSGMEKPGELDVYFFHPDFAPKYDRTFADTTYYDLPAGEYNIVAVNNAGKESYTGMDNYFTAQVTLPVRVTDSVVITGEAPLCLSAHNVTTVRGAGSECTITPAPLIKVIHFSFKIRASAGVTSVRASLRGVQTSAMLCTNEEVYGDATLPFIPERKEGNDFYKPVSLLGFAPGTVNLLTVYITCRNGATLETVTDLSGRFNFQDSPVQSCTLTYDLDSTQPYPDIKIESWQPGTNGNININ